MKRTLVTRAAEMITDGGVEGLSMRKLALASGTTTNAVYTLFGSKSALMRAVLEVADASLVAHQQAVPTTDDPLADLAAILREYRRWALSNPALHQAMFGGRIPHDFGLNDDVPPRRPIDIVVDRCLEADVFAPAGAVERMMHIWATLHGMVMLQVTYPALLSEQAWESSFEFSLHHLISGISALGQSAPGSSLASSPTNVA